MQITIFGASGRVGREVVRIALAHGYQVTAFVHTHNPFEPHPHLRILTGDIANIIDVEKALEGSDAIISTLGSWRTSDKSVVSNGTQTIIAAMGNQDITRLITLTGTAVHATTDTPSWKNTLNYATLRVFAPKILVDGQKHLELLESSNLHWTCVRSPAMKDGTKTSYLLSNSAASPLARISRKAVAQCLIDQLTDKKYLQRAPVIHQI